MKKKWLALLLTTAAIVMVAMLTTTQVVVAKNCTSERCVIQKSELVLNTGPATASSPPQVVIETKATRTHLASPTAWSSRSNLAMVLKELRPRTVSSARTCPYGFTATATPTKRPIQMATTTPYNNGDSHRRIPVKSENAAADMEEVTADATARSATTLKAHIILTA